MKNMGALAIGILLLISSILSAQEITGNLEGRILDPDGQPLAGVQVAVTGASLQGVREAKTDERGYFRLFSLPTGIFTLKVHHEAFLDVSLESVRVQLGRTNSLGEIRLRQKVLEAQEIVVTAERPAIDPTSTATGLNLVADTIEDLPGPRNYRNVMAILPGANQSYYGDEVNVAGATGSENAYFIDGIDVSDPYKRYNNTSLPYNFIKEIEIKTGGYEAEYRSSLGGLVNAVTYSGGNEFSGQIFGFFTNNNFSQSAVRAELEPGKGDLSQYDFGFSLGGPIIRDKLWFFGAYNPTVAREDVLVPGLDYYEDKLTQNIFAGKITWQPSSKANFVLTAIGDPAKHNSVGFRSAVSQALNPDPMLTKITQGGYSFLASGHYIFSEEFFLEASLAYITRRDRSNPATERGKDELVFLDIGAGDVVSGGHRGESYGDSQQTTISIKGTLVQGDHILKAGFEYRDNKLDSFTNDRILFGYGPNDFILQTFNESGTVHNRIPSLFAQDSWRIGDRLNLNFGLRWCGEFLIGSDGKLAQRIADEYQPRIGFIFLPDRSGASRIFGSFGRFYQEISTNLMTWYQVENQEWHWISYDHDPRLDPSGGVDVPALFGIQPEVKGLNGQNYDEFVLGYEQAIHGKYKFLIQGILRNLRDGIEDAIEGFGNPGRAPLENFPKMKREYYGLELTLIKFGGKYFEYTASYTFSRSYGNYEGLFGQDLADNRINVTGQFDSAEEVINATGLLPNDRTHVFKFFGSYRFPFGFTAGAFFIWESGTPLSEIGTQATIPGWIKYLNRGKSGRTPSLADLNVRIAYQMRNVIGTKITPRIILDLFHIGSQREPVKYEQRHYLGVDEYGNQIDPNPLYMHATAYFPPMSARLGLEVNF